MSKTSRLRRRHEKRARESAIELRRLRRLGYGCAVCGLAKDHNLGIACSEHGLPELENA